MFLQLSIAFTFLSVILWRKTAHSAVFAALISFLVFFSLLLSGFYYFSDFFSGDGVNQAVLYHLTGNHMVGVGVMAFKFIIGIITAFVLVLLFIVFVVYKSVRTRYPLSRHKSQVGAAFVFLLSALIINPATLDIYSLYSQPDNVMQAQPPEDFMVIDRLESIEQPKNLVYLYLESFERSYFNSQVFPGLLPNLKPLKQQSVSFSNIHQAYGTDWTIAGMAASQCGIAFVTPLSTDRNSMFGVDSFLPRAHCLSDLLIPQGYSMHFVKGSALSFAGVGEFYKTHGFSEVYGRDHYLQKLEGNVEKNYWGLYDDTLFDQAKKKYDALSRKEQPFGLFLITVDTHNPGYASPSCQENAYSSGENPVLNAIHCSDQLAADFIQHILDSEQYKNTVLVVASDHYAMKFSNSAWKKLEQTERRNLLMMFSSDEQPRVVNSAGSTLDVAPTVLSLLGYDVTGLGFGRSLLDKKPTLFSKRKPFDDYLQQHNGFLKSLWFPGDAKGL